MRVEGWDLGWDLGLGWHEMVCRCWADGACKPTHDRTCSRVWVLSRYQ